MYGDIVNPLHVCLISGISLFNFWLVHWSAAFPKWDYTSNVQFLAFLICLLPRYYFYWECLRTLKWVFHLLHKIKWVPSGSKSACFCGWPTWDNCHTNHNGKDGSSSRHEGNWFLMFLSDIQQIFMSKCFSMVFAFEWFQEPWNTWFWQYCPVL